MDSALARGFAPHPSNAGCGGVIHPRKRLRLGFHQNRVAGFPRLTRENSQPPAVMVAPCEPLRGCRGRRRADVLRVHLAVGERFRLLHWLLNQLRTRLGQHQDGESFTTSHRGPWKLNYYEAYLNQQDALGRETYLKSGSGRRFLKAQLKHYLLQEPLARPLRPAV